MQISALAMAYIGDAVYELYIREYLVNKGIVKVKDLQRASIDFVSAKSQRKHLERLIANDFLTATEIETYKWGRNTHGGKAKHADIVTYRIATGFETLIGSLHINDNETRIKEIVEYIVGN